VPGKGNGTFGSPVLFSQQNTSISQQVLVADLNNDKKLDLVWNGAVYLGNGDGTFQQMPLGLSGTPLAVADLNGDGIPDVVMMGHRSGQRQRIRGQRQRNLPAFALLYGSTAGRISRERPPLLVMSMRMATRTMLLQYSTTTSTNAVTRFVGRWQGKFHAR
jgi:hypothetical protein